MDLGATAPNSAHGLWWSVHGFVVGGVVAFVMLFVVAIGHLDNGLVGRSFVVGLLSGYGIGALTIAFAWFRRRRALSRRRGHPGR